MSKGQVFFSGDDQRSVIKLVGEIRLTLCVPVEKALARVGEGEVAIDLTQTSTIDSTVLGLLAKLAITRMDNQRSAPTLASSSLDITRVLLSMGFEALFQMVDCAPPWHGEFEQFENELGSESLIYSQVLDAHKTLMGINDSNQQTFKALVESLEESEGANAPP